jgi:hypothetical protein
VCAISHLIKEDVDTVEKVIAIAGGLENAGGTQFDYDVTRLKTSDSNADSQKEGVRIVFKGGKHPLSGPSKERRPQRAVVEFLCDPDKTGIEDEWDAEDKYESSSLRTRADGEEEDDEDDEDDGSNEDSSLEHQLLNQNAALLWESYGPENDVDVLRMTWHTKYACEKRDDSDDDDGDESGSTKASWGFFTWFVIM